MHRSFSCANDVTLNSLPAAAWRPRQCQLRCRMYRRRASQQRGSCRAAARSAQQRLSTLWDGKEGNVCKGLVLSPPSWPGGPTQLPGTRDAACGCTRCDLAGSLAILQHKHKRQEHPLFLETLGAKSMVPPSENKTSVTYEREGGLLWRFL